MAETTMTTQVPGYYKCGHCALHFKTKDRYRRHEAICLSLKQIRSRATFESSSASAYSSTAYSLTALFELVQGLAVRLETAEHELSVTKRQLSKLTKQQQQHQHQHQQQQQPNIHRDNLLEWLNNNNNNNNNNPPQPFAEWVSAIPPISRDHLLLVFQHGFTDGMCAMIATLSLDSLRAYDEAPNMLFVYENTPKPEAEIELKLEPEPQQKAHWRPITHPEFERFINRMQKLLMNEFVNWQQEHKERWHDSDFAEQYDANLLKVTGSGKCKSGGCSNRDILITRMKPKVYAAIKRSANYD